MREGGREGVYMYVCMYVCVSVSESSHPPVLLIMSNLIMSVCAIQSF